MRRPCVRCHAIFVFAEACSCFRLRASLDEGIVRRRFLHSCRFLWSVVVAFPTRRRFIDGGRALRARSAEDCETAIRKRIARTVVTTVTRALERAARQRSLFACTKSRNENRDLKAYSCTAVQLLCPHEYLYEYIYIAQDDYYSCRMAEGGFFYFYTHALLRCWCCVCTLQ